MSTHTTEDARSAAGKPSSLRRAMAFRLDGSCPLGCSHPTVRSYFRDDAQSLKYCNQCSIVFVYPPPSKSEVESVYSDTYFEKKYDQMYASGYVSVDAHETRMASVLRRAATLCRTASGHNSRLLDIGCGSGGFLGVAQKHGWQVRGLELSPGIAKETSKRLGIPVDVGSVLDVVLPAGAFDVVTMFDVIEHLPEPAQALQVCHRALKPGGVLLITTPNFRGIGRRLVGRNAFGIWPNEHLVYFTASTLRYTLKRNGYERVQCATRNIYPENVAMLLNRLRGRKDGIPNMPSPAEPSVRKIKGLVRGNGVLKSIRLFVDHVFAHVNWGDELVAYAIRS